MVKWIDRILGAVFILGAVTKALDLEMFAVQIRAYHVITDPELVRGAAWTTLGIETILGIALLLSQRARGVTYAAAIGLIAVFTGLIAYAWAFHGLSDCGCFGAFITMTPGVSITKNLIMIAMAGAAWALTRGTVDEPASQRQRLALGGGSLAAVLIAGTYGSLQADAPPTMTPAAVTQTADGAPASQGPFAQFVFDFEGETYNLGQGSALVAMLSATCDHCMATVPALNELTYLPELPPVAALMIGSEQEMTEFRLITSPEFPTVRIDRLLFFNFVGSEPPRFHLVRDGVSAEHWDHEPPAIEELLAKSLE